MLDPDELSIIREIDFDEGLCGLIKTHAQSSLIRTLQVSGDGRIEPGPGISVAVKDPNEAERVMMALRESLVSRRYRAFWSDRRGTNGLKETDEVTVLKTADPYAIIRLR